MPVLNNVRYASDSDHSRYEFELTLWAKTGTNAPQQTAASFDNVSRLAAKRAIPNENPCPFRRTLYWPPRDKLGAIGAPYMRAARLLHMFNATLTIIEAFTRELRMMYERSYGTMEPGYPGVISFVAQLALENIATSDAATRC